MTKTNDSYVQNNTEMENKLCVKEKQTPIRLVRSESKFNKEKIYKGKNLNSRNYKPSAISFNCFSFDNINITNNNEKKNNSRHLYIQKPEEIEKEYKTNSSRFKEHLGKKGYINYFNIQKLINNIKTGSLYNQKDHKEYNCQNYNKNKSKISEQFYIGSSPSLSSWPIRKGKNNLENYISDVRFYKKKIITLKARYLFLKCKLSTLKEENDKLQLNINRYNSNSNNNELYFESLQKSEDISNNLQNIEILKEIYKIIDVERALSPSSGDNIYIEIPSSDLIKEIILIQDKFKEKKLTDSLLTKLRETYIENNNICSKEENTKINDKISINLIWKWIKNILLSRECNIKHSGVGLYQKKILNEKQKKYKLFIENLYKVFQVKSLDMLDQCIKKAIQQNKFHNERKDRIAKLILSKEI